MSKGFRIALKVLVALGITFLAYIFNTGLYAEHIRVPIMSDADAAIRIIVFFGYNGIFLSSILVIAGIEPPSGRS